MPRPSPRQEEGRRCLHNQRLAPPRELLRNLLVEWLLLAALRPRPGGSRVDSLGPLNGYQAGVWRYSLLSPFHVGMSHFFLEYLTEGNWIGSLMKVLK